MTDSPLITNAMKGALLGAALGYFEISISRRPSAEQSVLRYGAYGAGIGALITLFFESQRASPGAAPIVVVPPSPVVTKGYFAGSPRPLYHTQDAREHRRS
jgi:hypothetical protein